MISRREFLALIFLFCIIFLGQCQPRDDLYASAGEWLQIHTTPDATIFTLEPQRLAKYTRRQLISAPTDQNFAAALRDTQPDYCLVTPHLAWELVLYQAYFQDSYVLVHTINTPGDSASPLVIFQRAPLDEYRGGYRPVYEYDIGSCLHLVAYDIDTTVVVPEEPVVARLIWQVLRPIPYPNVGIAVRLTHTQDKLFRTRVYEENFDGVTIPQWAVGSIITTTHRISVPRTFPPGHYLLEAATFKTFLPFPLPPRARQPGYPFEYENWWLRMAIINARSQFQPPAISPPPIAVWDERIELVGRALPASIHPGDVVPVNLYWRARDNLPLDYTIFVHLTTLDGQLHTQHDSYPQNGLYPTTQWYPGDFISDTHSLWLPPETPPGEYAVWVGMYDLETMTRLNVSEADVYVQDNAIKLLTIPVTEAQ